MRHEDYAFKLEKIWPHYKLKTEYKGSNEDVTVLCKKHHEIFTITATRLTQNQTKCPECKREKREQEVPEEEIQMEFVKWFRITFPETLITANGVFKNKRQAGSAVSMGYCKGIPDVFVPEHKLFIEFKKPTGKVSRSQKKVMEELTKLGYVCHVCRSVEEAQKLFHV